MIIPSLLLLIAGSAVAQTALSPAASPSLDSAFARLRLAAAPTAEELIARLGAGERADRLAAPSEIGTRLGGFDASAQGALVAALRKAAESGEAPVELRAKAYLTLGQGASWLKDDGAKREAVEALAAALAGPGEYRRPALMGMKAAASHFPQDQALEEKSAQALLPYLSEDGPERTLALLALGDLITSRPRVLQPAGPVARPLETQVLDVASRGADAFCHDARWDDDARFSMVRFLHAYGRLGGSSSARMRVKDFLVGVSQNDPAGVLRELARLGADAIRD